MNGDDMLFTCTCKARGSKALIVIERDDGGSITKGMLAEALVAVVAKLMGREPPNFTEDLVPLKTTEDFLEAVKNPDRPG